MLKQIVFIIFLASSTCSLKAQPRQLDFSSVDVFFEFATQLKKGIQPSEEEWKRFFSTPFYDFYSYGSDNVKKFIRNLLSNAFVPEKKKQRDSIVSLSDNDYYKFMVNHLINVEKEKDRFILTKQRLLKENLIDSIFKLTKDFLPTDIKKRVTPPVISFGFYQPEGTANKTGVAADLKLVEDIYDYKMFLAHEAHHYYTSNLRKKMKTDSTNKQLVHIISQLHLEGIADLIDKKAMLDTKGKGAPPMLYTLYKKHYTDPIPNLQKVDSLLKIISMNPSSSIALSNEINNLLPLSGHPHGYFMGEIIQSVYGKKALVAILDNPFQFIYQYNKAAQRKRLFQFSYKTIQYLKGLERKVLL